MQLKSIDTVLGSLLEDILGQPTVIKLNVTPETLAKHPLDNRFLERLKTNDRVYHIMIDENLGDEKKVDLLLGFLGKLGEMGKRNRYVRLMSLQALKESNVKSTNGRRPYLTMIKAVQGWIHKNINYVNDPHRVEYFQRAEVTLQDRSGDCDDHAILAAAMLGSLGFPSGVLVIDAKGTGRYDHAMAVVKTPIPKEYKMRDTNTYKDRVWKGMEEWLPLELTRPMPPGWLPPAHTKTRMIELR